MDNDVYGLDGKPVGKIGMPAIFSGDFRPDLIRRAILSSESKRYQPQGHSVLAGLQTTAVYVGKYSGYRRGRHMGIAIRPRQKLGGGAMGDVRRIPSSVKGKRAHPHMIEKRITEEMNRREFLKAVESAIAGTAKSKLISQRHDTGSKNLPIVVDDSIEDISKAKELLKLLVALGLSKDLDLSKKPRIRKGLRRSSRQRRFRKSVLVVTDNDSKIAKAGRNIPGVDVCSTSSLDIEKLAPGAEPRLSVWSRSAVNGIEKKLSEAKK